MHGPAQRHLIKDITDARVLADEIPIPNKIVTFKPNDYQWNTCHIKSLI